MSETLLEALRRHVRESGRSLEDLEREIRSGGRILSRFARGESGIGIDLAERLVDVLGLQLVARLEPSALAERVTSLERRVTALEGGSYRPDVASVPPPGSPRRPSRDAHDTKPPVAEPASVYTEEQAARVKSLLRSKWAAHAIASDTGVSVETIDQWRAYWQRSGELT